MDKCKHCGVAIYPAEISPPVKEAWLHIPSGFGAYYFCNWGDSQDFTAEPVDRDADLRLEIRDALHG